MMFNGLLIGCGFFATNHMHGWEEADGARIAAVCDLDREKAQAMASKFGIERVYTDAKEALEAEKPDFVDVATTVGSHRMLVELALSHGATTICQKPFAESIADARAMVDAAAKAGKPLLVHKNFRWEKPMIEMRRVLDTGAIGNVNFAHLSFRHAYDVYAGQPYLMRTEKFALMDVGLHLFDLDRFLLGDTVDIHCRTQSLRPGLAGEDSFTATLGHESGAVSVVDCSFYSKKTPDPFPQTLVRVEGSDGTVELLENYRLRLHAKGEVTEKSVEPQVPAWGDRPWHLVQDSVAAFERHVVEVLRGEADPQPSGRHNLTTLAMALAAYRSAETGQTVAISDIERGEAS